MPLTVAPPPRNGDAAQGTWYADPPAFAASDRAQTHHDGPEPVPTLPTPAAIARTMAAGVLLSAGALSLPTAVLLIVAVVRAAANANQRLTFDGVSPVLLTIALALGLAATLAAPFWPWAARRRTTLALAALVTAAWPLSGHAPGAAAVAIVAVGLALARDQRTAGGRRAANWTLAAALGLPAFALALAGVAFAQAVPIHDAGSQSTAARQDGERAAAARSHRTTARAGHRAAVHTATHARAAVAFVRDYYAALDTRRFADAWAHLPPALRRQFGGFARWKDGYARTLRSTPTAVTSRADGNTLIVRLRLVAHEKDCRGVQTFAVTWRLRRVPGTWRVAGLRGRELGGGTCG